MRSVVAIMVCACGSSSSPAGSELGSGSLRCESDRDCVLACDFSDDDCCKLWTCEHVEHKDAAPAAAAFKSECLARNYECVADKTQTHIVRPRCQAGRCVGERAPIKK